MPPEAAFGAPGRSATGLSVVDGTLEVFIALGGLVDLDAERARLEKALAKARKDLAGAERTLTNQGFLAKAAPEVVEAKRARAKELAETIGRLQEQLADLS